MSGVAAAVLAALCAFACATRGAVGETWTPVERSALTDPQKDQYEAAVAARDAMFGELMGTLTDALLSDGPAEAIAVCKDEAPRIADSMSHELGVRMGRTAARLRNPDNLAPGWAESLLLDEPGEMRMAASSRGRLGVTMPIRLKGACVTCHGPVESIPTGVRDALAALYPADRATGFREGDLRGWFWVEVPPAPPVPR